MPIEATPIDRRNKVSAEPGHTATISPNTMIATPIIASEIQANLKRTLSGLDMALSNLTLHGGVGDLAGECTPRDDGRNTDGHRCFGLLVERVTTHISCVL